MRRSAACILPGVRKKAVKQVTRKAGAVKEIFLPCARQFFQMPLYRRIPKRGFHNRNSKEIVAINVSELNLFEDGTEVTIQALLDAGVIKKVCDGVKILGNGELTKKLTVKVNAYSASAEEKIKNLGGIAEVI